MECYWMSPAKATSPRLGKKQTYIEIHRNKNCKSGKMRGLRNTLQRKEQDKTTEGQSEVETSNLPDKRFKIMIIKMIKELN